MNSREAAPQARITQTNGNDPGFIRPPPGHSIQFASRSHPISTFSARQVWILLVRRRSIMERRKFISLAVNGTGVLAAGAVGVPSVLSSLSPVIHSEKGPEEWRQVGPADQFRPGEVKAAVVRFSEDPALETLASRSVYVWKQGESEFVVYSRACTDLGCPINWDPGSEWFFCPCHGGIFDKEGERKAGPPKKPLWRYATRVRDGILEIDLRSVPPMA